MEKTDVLNNMEQIKDEVQELSLKLWHNPEISGQEKESADLFRQALRSHDFKIKEIEGLEHAFIAEYGSGFPTIAVLGEYDALPGLSQQVDTKWNPVKQNAPGHGCGHNLLGAAALGAVLTIKEYLAKEGTCGTIRFYGCPEEETLAGKVKMIKKGVFEGCDVALSWHPMDINAAVEKVYLANNSIKFRFHGKSSHASQSPETGRSALDAVELMNVGANYLREHVIDKARIHYTITNAGGAPNIIPNEAESWYFVRAPFRKDVEEITERLFKIARGAATMTETTVDCEIISGCYEMLPNHMLFDLNYKNISEIRTPEYTENEMLFAKAIQETLDPDMVEGGFKKLISSGSDEKIYISQGFLDKEKAGCVHIPVSSDSGDVSWNIPMSFFTATCWPLGVIAHTWQGTASSGTSIAMKGMIYAVQVFTGMMYDLLNRPELVVEAKEEFARRTKKEKYVSPIK